MIPSSLQGTQAQFFDGPASISAISVLAVNTTQSPSNVLRVRVQPGDSLSSLSRKYRTTVSAIQELNHLPTDVIAVGRELLVPVPSPSSIERER